MKQILLSGALLCITMAVVAQYPTTVTTGTNCSLFSNFCTFTNSDEGFSSPSIYSNADDVTFNWNMAAGVELESSGLTVRSASLISPVYIQGASGTAVVGFRFEAPIGAEYRVRIISAVSGSPLEVLATTANGPVYTPLTALSGTVCLLLTDADLTTGRQVRFEFTFRLNHAGDVRFDDVAAAVAITALPVTFEGFTARKNDDGSLKLLWNVSKEINVRGYYVESSTNGVNFTVAGYTAASGKTIYAFDMADQAAPTMYFRIKNLDIDGRSKYSPVIKVYDREQPGTAIQIYPMPASDLVTVQHGRSSINTVISLYNQEGKILQQVLAAPYTYQTQFPTANLPRGVYIVGLNNGSEKAVTAKLIKY